MANVLVTGAGGFIGHHLVNYLKGQGHWVRAADLKQPLFAPTQADEFHQTDLRRWEACLAMTQDIELVFSLAADMGGIGYISTHHAEILSNNLLISAHMIEAAHINGVKKYFYPSSAFIYPTFRQTQTDILPLKESDAMPADPEDAYGWEKLVGEQLTHHYHHSYGLETYTARFHNVYGPLGSWEGGREKAPAALCRKVAIAKLTGNPEVEIWGDGQQTRSFFYIDDALEGVYRLVRTNFHDPVNLGSDRLITINDLAHLIAEIAETEIVLKHIKGPQGARGRNSDNSLLRQVLGWEPQIPLEVGLRHTYTWIEAQIQERIANGQPLPV